jgi:hypothetical protein
LGLAIDSVVYPRSTSLSQTLVNVLCLERKAVPAMERGAPSFFFWEALMGKKLYVGNLAYGVTDSTLEQLFVAHGAVQSAKVVIDRDTGRSKGFGFVEMSSDAEAQAATTALNLKEVEGRSITVNEARPKTEGRTGAGTGGSRRY